MVIVAERTFRTAKFSALVSFLLCVGTQLRAQFATRQPDGEPYSPLPVALFSFLAVQGLSQAYWLRTLFLCSQDLRCEPPLLSAIDEESMDSIELPPNEVVVESTQMAYTPLFTAGNILLTCANQLWIQEIFVGSQVLYICCALSQLYAVFVILGGSRHHSLSSKNILTHVVAKSSAGLGMLYVWKGWGAIDGDMTPPVSQLVQSIVLCLLLTVASGPDPTLGLCIIYDLVALICGPGSSDIWRRTFKYEIVIITVTVMVDVILAKSRGIRIIRDDTSGTSSRRTSGYVNLETEEDKNNQLESPLNL